MVSSDSQSRNEDIDSHRKLLELAWGYIGSELLDVAVSLDLADLMRDQSIDSSTIAGATHTHAPTMLRVLRALCSLGLMSEIDHDLFTLTSVGERLRTDVPHSLNAFVRQGGGVFRDVWSGFRYSVRTGQPAFQHVVGEGFFEHLTANPDLAEMFNTAMRQGTRGLTSTIGSEYDFSRYTTVVDVGGGNGTLLEMVLGEHLSLTGVLFDTFDGLLGASDNLRKGGVLTRCEIRAGDFFDSVPSCGDLYVLKSVLHDWGDQDSLRILDNCRLAMPQHATLLIMEVMLPSRATDPGAAIAHFSDLHMLVSFGGRERTQEQFEELLSEAGFSVMGRTSPLSLAPFTLIEARPPGSRGRGAGSARRGRQEPRRSIE